METQCEFCNKIFNSKGNLIKHQKTTKFCIKIQKEQSIKEVIYVTYNCQYCKKEFSQSYNLERHLSTCIEKLKQEIIENKIIINENNQEKQKLKDNIIELKTENNILKEQQLNKDQYIYINELQEKLQELALASIEQKNELISGMIKKYVKKQPRQRFDEQNVIYILTTSSLQKDRRYILGKAKNLTNRLSTYNKTDEHKVIFYQGCEDEDTMNFLEPLVFKKLKEYREQANRERFILPEDKNIDFFIDTIKNCFEFLK